jgi:hypothetical protein
MNSSEKPKFENNSLYFQQEEIDRKSLLIFLIHLKNEMNNSPFVLESIFFVKW